MKRLALASLILTLTCLGGCIGKVTNRVNSTMASWEGHHYSELLSSCGPPQQVLDDGSGGRTTIYTPSQHIYERGMPLYGDRTFSLVIPAPFPPSRG